MKIKVVYFATPKIALKTLEELYASDDFEVLAVVTQPDKPAGRGYKLNISPIKEFALEHNIKIFQPKSIKKDVEVLSELRALSPDFFVTFAFGQILSQEVLDIPKFATVNLHASLLPQYRGANPIQRAIIEGNSKTGICTMITELGLDCGDVCMRKEIEITEQTDCLNLFEEISEKSPELVKETLKGLFAKKLIPQKQCGDATLALKLSKEETKIDWTKSAEQIHNLVRGICRCPSAYFELNGKAVKVIKSMVCDGNGKCGEFLGADKDGVNVATASGVLKLVIVKPEGKGEMRAVDWFRGVRL